MARKPKRKETNRDVLKKRLGAGRPLQFQAFEDAGRLAEAQLKGFTKAVIDADGYAAPRKRRSKYRAVPTVVDGIRFDSKKESRRYLELKLLLQAGKISNLTPHDPVELFVLGKKIGKIVIDFTYKEGDDLVYEDVKSPATITQLFKWKSKHFEAQTGCKIRLVL